MGVLTGALGPLDLAIVAGYAAATIALGLRSARSAGGRTDEFLLAGRTLTLPAFVVTLVATWYGGVLGVGEYSYLHGLSNWIVLGAPYYVGTALFAWAFAERARRSETTTVPDLLHGAYGRGAGALGTFVVFVLSLPAAYFLMLGVILRRALGIGQATAIVLSAAICLAYLLARGFRGVVGTKGLQFALMYGGFLVLLPAAVVEVGGLGALAARLPPEALTATGGKPVGYVVAWYVIALQTLVEPTFYQRCFAARSPRVARTGLLVSIAFFALFDAMTTFTGMYARALLPDLPSAVDAYPALAERLLPAGLLGLFYAGMLATVLSTVDSFLFVGATTFGRDLVWRLTGGRADQVTWTRIGLAVATAASAALALAASSVVSLWYGFYSVGTAVLLAPLAGALFPALRPPGAFAAAGMVLAGSATLATFAWGGGAIEPIYPGLAVSFLVHGAGLLSRRL